MYCTADNGANCMRAPLDGVHLPPRVAGFMSQGLAQEWNFNQHESGRNFMHATTLEPGCAVCWWGIARSLASNINRQLLKRAEFNAAAENATRAARCDPHAGPKVRALVETIQLLRLPSEQERNSTAVDESLQRYAAAMCARYRAPGALALDPVSHWWSNQRLCPQSSHTPASSRLSPALVFGSRTWARSAPTPRWRRLRGTTTSTG